MSNYVGSGCTTRCTTKVENVMSSGPDFKSVRLSVLTTLFPEVKMLQARSC